MKNLKRCLVIFPFLLCCLPTAPVIAGTQAEYQALQQWCVGRDKWTAEGKHTDYPNPPEYFHFHHYCAAMNAMNKLYSMIDARKQQYQAGLVVGETGYVLTHVAENHPLMPEVYALRGRALALIKQTGQAETNLMKALQLDPRHVGAYSSLGNLYLDSGRKAKAIESAKAGLTADPQNKSLRRLAGKLGMNLEELKLEPTALAGQPTQTSPGKLGDTPAMDAAKSATEKSPATAVVPAAPAGPAEDGKGAHAPPAKPAEKPVNRDASPKNPWCRFCPDSTDSPPSPDPAASRPEAAPKAGR